MSRSSNGLARPVRAQEPEHLTGGDAERHILHSGPSAENLAQVAALRSRPCSTVNVLVPALVAETGMFPGGPDQLPERGACRPGWAARPRSRPAIAGPLCRTRRATQDVSKPLSDDAHVVEYVAGERLDPGVHRERPRVVGRTRVEDPPARRPLPVDQVSAIPGVSPPVRHEPRPVIGVGEHRQALGIQSGHALCFRQSVHLVAADGRAVVGPRPDEVAALERDKLWIPHQEVAGRAHGERSERRLVPAIDPAQRLQAQEFARRLTEVGPLAPGKTVRVPPFTPFVRRQPRDAGAFAGVSRLARFDQLDLRVVADPPERGVAAQAQDAAATAKIRVDPVTHPLGPVFVVPHDHQRREALQQLRIGVQVGVRDAFVDIALVCQPGFRLPRLKYGLPPALRVYADDIRPGMLTPSVERRAYAVQVNVAYSNATELLRRGTGRTTTNGISSGSASAPASVTLT